MKVLGQNQGGPVVAKGFAEAGPRFNPLLRSAGRSQYPWGAYVRMPGI